MEPVDTADATAAAVGSLAGNFMLDPGTYAKGAELGFSGVDFYVGGRAGVLGPVDADVVSAAFAFFEPGNVRTLWEQALGVMDPGEASSRFMACGHQWAIEHLGDGVDWARTAELLGAVCSAASPAVAPLFAAWRATPEPDGSDAKALALHRFNLMRELRNGVHAAAVVSSGLLPVEALPLQDARTWRRSSGGSATSPRWATITERCTPAPRPRPTVPWRPPTARSARPSATSSSASAQPPWPR